MKGCSSVSNNQKEFNWVVVFGVDICLLLIPILVFPKPIIIYLKQKYQTKKKSSLKLETSYSLGTIEFQKLISIESGPSRPEDDHAESFMELLIHQIIHSIEFVLGVVSNTASYLRLWALSLAHHQLSVVFYQKTLLRSYENASTLSCIDVILSTSILILVSFFILILMDLLECFLHTLRLHWVEFQNKFYEASGNQFNEFSYR